MSVIALPGLWNTGGAKGLGYLVTFALFRDISLANTLHAGDQAWVFNHVRHKFRWVAANGVKLEVRRCNEVGKRVVRCYAHTVAVLLELVAERDEGLYIAAASNHLDHNVQGQRPFLFWSVVG